MDISVVIPIFNEIETLPHLYTALHDVLDKMDCEYEVLFVDDGSTDGSDKELFELAEYDSHIKVIEFRSNFGQTAAMSAGIKYATGDVIVTMDGDLQNDPTDIPMMLDKINEGYDLVHGWRKDRQDAFINRKLPSKVANWLISKVTNFPVNDLGCTLKAIRREVAQELELYGEMHRFIPILAKWRGAKCTEVVTKHHARKFGTTKYGIGRVVRVLLDLITVKYLTHHLASPMKLFGIAGLACGAFGIAAGVATIVMKLYQQVDMTGNPLLMLSVFSSMVGIQFFVLGMLGELGARTYFEVRNQQPYAVRYLLNFESSETTNKSQLSEPDELSLKYSSHKAA